MSGSLDFHGLPTATSANGLKGGSGNGVHRLPPLHPHEKRATPFQGMLLIFREFTRIAWEKLYHRLGSFASKFLQMIESFSKELLAEPGRSTNPPIYSATLSDCSDNTGDRRPLTHAVGLAHRGLN